VIRLSSADTDTTTTEETAEPAEPVERDEIREQLLARLTELLDEGDIVESHLEPGVDLCVRLDPAAWKRAFTVARDELGFKFFEFVSAIDWMPSPYGKSEDATVDVEPGASGPAAASGPFETGTAGGDTRFQVFGRLMDISRHSLAITFKADVADGGSIESLVSVFPGANWSERETHEMMGIRFDGHPFLETLYLPSGFEGHPLRKDFPLLSRHVKPWPGIVDVEPMPGGDDDEAGDEKGDES
jgi:NADH-quinone oxidoreductase subunit C